MTNINIVKNSLFSATIMFIIYTKCEMFQISKGFFICLLEFFSVFELPDALFDGRHLLGKYWWVGSLLLEGFGRQGEALLIKESGRPGGKVHGLLYRIWGACHSNISREQGELI